MEAEVWAADADDNGRNWHKKQQQSLTEYREENSSVEGFIGECLEEAEGNIMAARQLYEEYKQYCMKDGRKFKSAIAFTKEMKSYGKRYNKYQMVERLNGHDSAKFEGVRIRKNWEDEREFKPSSPLDGF